LKERINNFKNGFLRLFSEIGQSLTDFFEKNNIIDFDNEQLVIHQTATDEL